MAFGCLWATLSALLALLQASLALYGATVLFEAPVPVVVLLVLVLSMPPVPVWASTPSPVSESVSTQLLPSAPLQEDAVYP
uniref:Putative secreted protein n=1 Tax=Anopheles darlingi TaxID=43151 RepID=A0A2M4DQY8_ANODA